MSASDTRVRVLRRRVETTRDDLGRFVSELDRRRQDAMDVKLQVRRHPVAAAAVVLGAAGLVAGGTWAAVRAAKRRKVRSIAVRISDAFRALSSDGGPQPKRAAPAPPPAAIAMRVVGAVVPVVAGLVARRAVGLLSDRVNGQPRRRA